MEKEPNFNNPVESDFLLDVSARVGEVTEEELNTFRNKLEPTRQKQFDIAGIDTQRRLCFIYNSENDVIEKLNTLADQNIHVPNLHNIKTCLIELKKWTNEERFKC